MGFESHMRVAERQSTDARIIGGPRKRFQATQFLDRSLWKLQQSPIDTWRSPARFGSLTAAEINASSASIVNLHWITDGFLSVEEIGKITKPMIWSMYDMWPFCGTEHYGVDAPDARWVQGYSQTNRSTSESGFDIDLWTFRRKKRYWAAMRGRTVMVPASSWLELKVRESDLMGDWTVERIPHLIDTSAFAPLERGDSRRAIGLDAETPLIVFLSSAGLSDHRKGWDLLRASLRSVAVGNPRTEIAIAGPVPSEHDRREVETSTPLTIRWLGSLATNEELRLVYSAADVVAVPSREDTMPLSAMEAQSCGRPVVCFRIGGLPDIVHHGQSGYLTEPFDTSAFGANLARALEESDILSKGARQNAQENFSSDVVVGKYQTLVQALLSD
jgi:glycosyltransferase involved in cell wall biosynthesis